MTEYKYIVQVSSMTKWKSIAAFKDIQTALEYIQLLVNFEYDYLTKNDFRVIEL